MFPRVGVGALFGERPIEELARHQRKNITQSQYQSGSKEKAGTSTCFETNQIDTRSNNSC